MARSIPGARAKGLGAELRRLRENAHATLDDAAKVLGKSKQIVHRLERGERSVDPDEVARLLGAYGVTGTTCERVLAMARTVNEPGWWEVAMPGTTSSSVILVDYEDSASRIVDWAPLLIPGLLQTMQFSRAVMSDGGLDGLQIEARLTMRMRRQHRLTRDDVTYLALIGEPALLGVGEAHRGQLDALLVAMERPNIDIRVVPTLNIPPRARLGAFIAFESPTVVHIEMDGSGVFLDEPAMTDPYMVLLGRLEGVALSESESMRRIVGIRDSMEA